MTDHQSLGVLLFTDGHKIVFKDLLTLKLTIFRHSVEVNTSNRQFSAKRCLTGHALPIIFWKYLYNAVLIRGSKCKMSLKTIILLILL